MNAVPGGKLNETITFSASAGLIETFQAEARKAHGERGVSKAGQEAMTSWLGTRGVDYVEQDALQTATRLRKLEALEEMGVDIDAMLDRGLEEAAQPALPLTGTG